MAIFCELRNQVINDSALRQLQDQTGLTANVLWPQGTGGATAGAMKKGKERKGKERQGKERKKERKKEERKKERKK